MRRLFPLLLLALCASPALAEPEGLSGVLEQSGATSPEQKLAFADEAVAEIQGAVKAVEKMLADEEKRKDPDTEAIECLQRRLTPLKVMLESAQGATATLKAASAAGDTVHADQEYRKVAVALSKARDFFTEAQTCVGDLGAVAGDNDVSLDEGGLGAEPPLVDEVPVDVIPGSPN